MKRNSFTLGELTVITACAVLCLTAVTRLHIHAAGVAVNTKCANNLKQLYDGAKMYAEDNSNFSPGSRTHTKGWTDPRHGAAVTWKSLLIENGYADYPGDSNRGIFACPDRPDKMYGNFYTDMQGYGTWHLKGFWGDFVLLNGSTIKIHGQQLANGPYDRVQTPLKLNKQPFQPAEFNLISDTKCITSKTMGQWFYATRTAVPADFAGGEGAVALPHAGRGNMVFADGHVAALNAAELNDLGWLKSRRWEPEVK
ncbi:MAG: hypothetical protein E7056_09325 [Lentisphaerae bacterium]|nr:hypothetical protein [Lentisphaerota bacterium]